MILIAGALIAETAPVLMLMKQQTLVSKRIVRGTFNGREILLLTLGVGPEKSYERSRQVIQEFPVEHVISVGTCGSLVDRLSIGDVITADEVFQDEDSFPAVPLLDFQRAKIITVSTVVDDPERRVRLAKRGQVCEMEASGVARAAGNVTFSALKVVSDQAGRDSDPVFRKSGLNRAQSIALFYARATKLCTKYLKPAIEKVLLA